VTDYESGRQMATPLSRIKGAGPLDQSATTLDYCLDVRWKEAEY